MKESKPIPSSEPRPWTDHIVRFFHRLANLAVVKRTRQRIAKVPLSGFLLRRSNLGMRFSLRARKLSFSGRRVAHIQGEQFHSLRRGAEAIWNLAGLALSPAVWVALTMTLFLGVPSLYERLARSRGWITLSLPSIEPETYLGLMVTVGQAAAVVLALFFAAVSIVTSTSYVEVTTGVRLLVAQDDLNRRYLRLLAHTAAVALIGAGLHAIGVSPSTALACYVIVIACICLLAFFPLGVRTFRLFDPSNLTKGPVQRFVRAVRNVTQHGRRWLDPSFQNHGNRIGEQQLRLLAGLVHSSVMENRSHHKVVFELAASISRLARFYATNKLSIPSDSRWFTQRPKFERWDLASSFATIISLQTGVAPDPKAVPDHGFVEAQCKDMTVKCLRHLFERDALDEAGKLLLDVSNTTTTYAQLFEQTESIQLVTATRTVLLEHLRTVGSTRAPLKQLQLVEGQCVAALAPILYPAIQLTEGPVEDLVCHEDGLLRLNRRRLYSTAHPRCVLKSAEDLLQRLEFEKEVEGVIRTQPWFVRQVIALAYARAIREVITNIVNTIEQEFVEPASGLIRAKQSSSAGVWLQRGIEACHKAKDRIEALQDRYAELKGFHVTEVPWLPSGAEDALPKVETARVEIVRQLAGIVPNLCAMPTRTDLPDLLGQTRASVAEELMLMMERKQEDGFDDLFDSYFDATSAVLNHFLALARQPGKEDYIRGAMDAMLDLMDLSGLAFLFSELDGTQFSSLVARTWDLYFDQAGDEPAMVRVWYGAINSKITLPVFSPSAMQRQAWHQRFARVMEDRGIKVSWLFDKPWGRHRGTPHPSPVISSFIAGGGPLMQSPHDYFAALFLAKQDEAKGIQIPPQIQSCLDSIEIARKQQEENHGGEKT